LRLAWGTGGHGPGSTIRLRTVPIPSTSSVTTSPGTSGGGIRSPVRPQISVRQPRWQVPEASTSPGATAEPRDAKLISSSNVNAQLARGVLAEQFVVHPGTQGQVEESVTRSVWFELVGGHQVRTERVGAVLPLEETERQLACPG
jgi:hypothetical protein